MSRGCLLNGTVMLNEVGHVQPSDGSMNPPAVSMPVRYRNNRCVAVGGYVRRMRSG